MGDGKLRTRKGKQVAEVGHDQAGGSREGTEVRVSEEVVRLVDAARRGELKTRARVELFHGEDRTLIEGVNEMLDAVIGPLNVAAKYVDQI